jgi:hypothetical protein
MDDAGRVQVICGHARGWYCPEKDEVLLQHESAKQQQSSRSSRAAARQQQQQMWLSRSAFMKLGGEGSRHDAGKAVKLLLHDSQPGMTLVTFLKKHKLAQQQQLQQGVSRVMGHGSSSEAAAAADAVGAAAGSRASRSRHALQQQKQQEDEDADAAGSAGTTGVKSQGRSRVEGSSSCSTEAAVGTDEAADGICHKGAANTTAAATTSAQGVFERVWALQQQQQQLCEVRLMRCQGGEGVLQQLPGFKLAAIFEQLWQ